MLDKLKNWEDLHTALRTCIIYSVTSLSPKSLDRMKLLGQRMCHVGAVPGASLASVLLSLTAGHLLK